MSESEREAADEESPEEKVWSDAAAEEIVWSDVAVAKDKGAGGSGKERITAEEVGTEDVAAEDKGGGGRQGRQQAKKKSKRREMIERRRAKLFREVWTLEEVKNIKPAPNQTVVLWLPTDVDVRELVAIVVYAKNLGYQIQNELNVILVMMREFENLLAEKRGVEDDRADPSVRLPTPEAELQMQEVNNVVVHNLSPGMVTTDLLMSGANTKQAKFFINILAEPPEVVAEFLVRCIRAIPSKGSTKSTYIRFLTGLRAYSQIFSRFAFGTRRNRYLIED